jgi:alcohol oxidase
MCRGSRAVGVEYVDDTVGRLKNGTPKSSIVRASRLVVLSSGTFGNPAILERYAFSRRIKVSQCLSLIRSGIGATDVLQRNNIPQVVDLPGVGENFLGRLQYSCLAMHDLD